MHLMKNILLVLLAASLVTACSSGTTVSPSPSNVTQLFQGTFQNNPGTESGTVTLNIVDDGNGGITGNISFSASPNPCLRNGTVTGDTSGFNINFVVNQDRTVFTITTTVTEINSDGTTGDVTTTIRTASSGTVGTVMTTTSTETRQVITASQDLTGDLNAQIAISNNGSTLSGTYVVSGNACSNQTGTGTMNLSS